MKRKIIRIDEDKCDGCGQCIPNCPEGAIRVIDGKARLVGDLFCDGLGACMGTCPQGAITVEEREARAYDEEKVMENIVKAGPEAVRAHLTHLREHGRSGWRRQAREYLKKHKIPLPDEPGENKKHAGRPAAGCPGRNIVDLRAKAAPPQEEDFRQTPPSELRNWPVQLKLLNPQAPYFKNADLAVAADCTAFAFAGFHGRFLKGKTLIIFCPKLDDAFEEYVGKLGEIFKANDIRSIAAVHMEVPCCFGVGQIVAEALKAAGKKIAVEDYTVSLKGEVLAGNEPARDSANPKL